MKIRPVKSYNYLRFNEIRIIPITDQSSNVLSLIVFDRIDAARLQTCMAWIMSTIYFEHLFDDIG